MVYAGATAMWGIAKILKKRHNLTDDVRSHIYDACNKWTKELEKRKTKFLGGKQPNLADLSVYGVLSSMEGCQAFKDCVSNTSIGKPIHIPTTTITVSSYTKKKKKTIRLVSMFGIPNFKQLVSPN